MKISGPGKTDKTSGAKKTGASRNTGNTAFSGLMGVSGNEETEETQHSAAAGTIARVDVLLAAQGMEAPEERAAKKRMKKRSEGILRALDKIRLGMLTGNMTVGNMIDIADVVASHREKINDPQLASLLDEIDLRAQIELAKMRMALDASKVF